MFTLLGVLVALYTVYAVARGEVVATHRAWGRRIGRSSNPRAFWSVVVVYAGLSLALLLVF